MHGGDPTAPGSQGVPDGLALAGYAGRSRRCLRGVLIEIKHPHRLRSAAEAMALIEALGARSVRAHGFETSDRSRIARVVAAATSDADTYVSWYDGSLADAWPQLAAFTLGGEYRSLHVTTAGGSLSVWTGERCRFHAVVPSSGLAPFEEVVCTSITRQPTTLFYQGRSVGDVQLIVHRGEPDEIELETPWVQLALAMFSRLPDPTLRSSFVTGPTDAGKPALTELLTRTGSRVDATLILTPRAACALTELFAGAALDWQADGVTIEFPQRRIRGHLTSPDHDADDRRAWRERIDRALRKAGLD